MIPEPTLRAVCQALRNRPVLHFVRNSVRQGYLERFSTSSERVQELIDTAFDELVRSQSAGVDPAELLRATSDLLAGPFHKGVRSFWFNRGYHHYKTRIKPKADLEILKGLIQGRRVLDYGCGSGYLAARLAEEGYEVLTTDVLDYRYQEARRLPFKLMSSTHEIPFADNSADSAIVQAVLHHIEPSQLSRVLRELSRIANRVVIKEDTYGLPVSMPGLEERLQDQPLLREFTGMAREDQLQALILIDYYANAVAQGLPEMTMPFAFKKVRQWWDTLEANGLRTRRTLLAGFEPGRMHKSCHVWFVCDRTL